MMAKQGNSTLFNQFAQILETIIAPFEADVLKNGLAVAFSGGLDSSALFFLTRDYCAERGIPLFAFHIHHGLSTEADNWLIHCSKASSAANVHYDFRRVSVKPNEDGIEASARSARYLALGQLCVEHKVGLILTAHHLDDQAETILLQLLRGSGVAGLSGMDFFNRAPGLFGTASVMLARPLLEIPRKALALYVGENQIPYVEDASNADPAFARNALRHQVMPVLDKIAHGYAVRLARSARHIQSAARMLEALAQQDFVACGDGAEIDVQRMRELGADRADNLLRFWLSQHNVRMPSTARLTEIRRQLFDAKNDATVSILHDRHTLHRYQNKLFIEHLVGNADDEPVVVALQWKGEAFIALPVFKGALFFDFANYGVDANLLTKNVCQVNLRKGGERLKLSANRPTRDMKHHYQALSIPFWQRSRLPFFSIDGKLVFAAGVGIDAAFGAAGAGRVMLRWAFDE